MINIPRIVKRFSDSCSIKRHYHVGIIGMGYVGLVVAGVLSKDHYVKIYDIDQNKMEAIKKGQCYISEPDLNEYYSKIKINNMLGGGIKTVTDINELVNNSKIIFVTVGTPSNIDGSINLSYVEAVAEDIGNALVNVKKDFKYIILKSTVVPTTTQKFNNILKKYVNEKNYELLYSPEFLAEGTAVKNMLDPDIIVVGSETGKIPWDVEEMFRTIHGEQLYDKLFITTWENAEMIKYANNAFLSTKISFINQIADICEKIPNCDVNVVAEALGYDKRISPLFLRAGLGYGGSCFAKDLDAISKYAETLNVDVELLKDVNKYNHLRRYIPENLIWNLWNFDSLKTKTITILGLSFKPNTDDIRDSPALTIINSILETEIYDGMKINVYDPQAADIDKHGYGTRLVRCPSAKYALKGANMAIICTEWDEFKKLEPDDFLLLMKEPIVIDGRRVLEDPERFIRAGIKYYGIGYGNNATDRKTLSTPC